MHTDDFGPRHRGLPTSLLNPRLIKLARRLCDDAGRDYDAIEKTAPFGFDVGEDGSKAGEVIEQLRWLSGMGIETVIGWVVGVDRIRPLEVMARELIPAAAALRPGDVRGAGVPLSPWPGTSDARA